MDGTGAILTIATLSVGAVLCLVALRERPQHILAAWAVVAFTLPYWVGLEFGGSFMPVSVAWGALCAFAALLSGVKLQVHAIDLMVMALCGLCLVAVLTLGSDAGDFFAIAGRWVLFYFLGKLIYQTTNPERITGVLAAAGALLGGIAVMEFALDWHPFASLELQSTASSIWSPIQLRGGMPRSEFSFGHSIALGSVIAALVPYVVWAKWKRWATGLTLAVMLAGILVTFSRSAILVFVLGIVLAILLSARKHASGRRVGAIVALTVAGVLLVPAALRVYGRAGAEVTASAAQRIRMLELVPYVQPIGPAGNAVAAPDGRVGYAGARGIYWTVDNAMLVTALQFGLIIAVALALLLVGIAACALRAMRSPVAVSFLAQLPVVLMVDFITQYAAVFWLSAGMAVAVGMARRSRSGEVQPADLVSQGRGVG